MSFVLNDKIINLEPYTPVAGEYAIRLDANESFLPPSTKICKEIAQAVESVDFRRYPDPAATKLTQAFAAYYQTDPALVTAGNGSDELISLLLTAFTQKGDKVLTFTPDFSMYAFFGTLTECEILQAEKNPDFTIDIDDALRQAKGVRMILFSNPCNPTSLTLAREEVLRLVAGTDALVVVDEAYMDFAEESVLHDVAAYYNLLVLRTCSKAIGMASLRLGFAVANKTITHALRAVKAPYNVNALSQAVGCVVLSHQETLRANTQRICQARDTLVASLQQMWAATGSAFCLLAAEANFVFAKSDRAEELCAFLEQKGIIIRRFGAYLRVTVGNETENAAFCAALTAFCRR